MYKIEDEKRKLILTFIEKYATYFTEEDKMLLEMFKRGETPFYDTIIQLITYFHAIEEEFNPRYEFYQNLKEKFPNLSQRKILEVSCGYIPALSYIINEHEKMTHPIIAMDPKCLPLAYSNIITLPTVFTTDTNIENKDLLIASCPCEGFEPMMQKCIQEEKEMCVQLCMCGHSFRMRIEWLNYIENVLKQLKVLEKSGFNIEKEYYDFSRLIDAPVITVRKRTR